MDFPAYNDLINDVENLDLIKTFVDDILSTVHKYISQAIEQMSSGKISVPLPVNFNLPMHDPADARRKVYYYLITTLESKGYTGKFYLTRGRTAGKYFIVFNIKHEMRPERKNYINEKLSQYVRGANVRNNPQIRNNQPPQPRNNLQSPHFKNY